MLDEFKNLNFLQRVLKLKSIFAEMGGIVATGDGQGITRSGADSDQSFQFIQLSDFIKDAYKYCEDLDILPMVSGVVGDKAVMTLYDASKEIEDQPNPLRIEISSLRTSGLGEMQGIGSQITFSRRYLWITFLDLCARDELDEGVYNEEIEKALNDKEKAEEEVKAEKPKRKAPAKPTSNMKKPENAVQTEPDKAPVVEPTKPATAEQVETVNDTVSNPSESVKTEDKKTVKSDVEDENAEEETVPRTKDEILADIKMIQNYKDRLNVITDKNELITCYFNLFGLDPNAPDSKNTWNKLCERTFDVIKAKSFSVCDKKIANFENELKSLG